MLATLPHLSCSLRRCVTWQCVNVSFLLVQNSFQILVMQVMQAPLWRRFWNFHGRQSWADAYVWFWLTQYMEGHTWCQTHLIHQSSLPKCFEKLAKMGNFLYQEKWLRIHLVFSFCNSSCYTVKHQLRKHISVGEWHGAVGSRKVPNTFYSTFLMGKDTGFSKTFALPPQNLNKFIRKLFSSTIKRMSKTLPFCSPTWI